MAFCDILNKLNYQKKTYKFVLYMCKFLLNILKIKSEFFMYEIVTFLSGHPVHMKV